MKGEMRGGLGFRLSYPPLTHHTHTTTPVHHSLTHQTAAEQSITSNVGGNDILKLTKDDAVINGDLEVTGDTQCVPFYCG